MKRWICVLITLTCFALLALGRPSAADAPRICHVSSGGGTSIVIGDGFDKSTQVLVWNTSAGHVNSPAYIGDPNGPAALPATPPADAKALMPIDIASDQVLDVELPQESMVLWVKTSGGISAPRLVNAPEIYLVSDEKPLPGEQVRLFGRNFCLNDTGDTSTPGLAVLFRSRKTGKTTSATIAVLSEQEWEHTKDHVIGVIVPQHLAPGPYDILVHSAFSRAFAWSAAYKVDVVAHRSLAAAFCRFDQASAGTAAGVQPVTGAAGDGLHDDAPPIQSALDHAAASAGGVVMLPAGQYAITSPLHIPPGVFLRGAGVDATSIVASPILPMKYGPSDIGAPYPREMLPLIWMQTRSGVSDMSLIGGPGSRYAIYVAPLDRNAIAEDVSVLRMNITTAERMFQMQMPDYPGYQDMFGVTVASGSRNFTIAQCHVKTMEPLWLNDTGPGHYGATVTNNTFEDYPRQSTDTVVMMLISHCVIEDNDVIGGARSFGFGRGFNHCWLFNNRITDDGGRANAEEMFMSEYGQSWAGGCRSASANTLRAQGAQWTIDRFANKSYYPAFVFIKLGKGFGQLRQVTSNTSDTLTVDAPWDIVPDSTSRFAIVPVTYRNLYINDQTIHCNGRCEFAYGSLAECVISGLNTRDSEGISSTAIDGGIIAFNDYSYNRLIGFSGIRLQSPGEYDTGFTSIPGIDSGAGRRGNVIANTIRCNEVMDFRAYPLNQYGTWWDERDQPPANKESGINVSDGSFNVIDDNYVTKGAVGIRIDGGEGNVVTHNRIDDVLTPLTDLGRNTFTKE